MPLQGSGSIGTPITQDGLDNDPQFQCVAETVKVVSTFQNPSQYIQAVDRFIQNPTQAIETMRQTAHAVISNCSGFFGDASAYLKKP